MSTNGTLNEVRIIGRLGTDVELRYTPNGSAVATLYVYTNRSWERDGEQRTESERHKVVCWGKLAESCTQYLAKGARVELTGSIHYPTWDDRETGEKRYGVEIRARRVNFLDRQQEALVSDESAEIEPPAELPEEVAEIVPPLKPKRIRKAKLEQQAA